MYKICLFVIVLVLGAPMLAAASNDCPPLQYYNGASCAPCSTCPRGFGVKTQCSALKDTECQECWPGYDYSGTNDMTPCIKCINDRSNCPDGNFKVIRKCTIYSPTLCSGCDEGNYFDNSTGLDGGCVECSKCAIDEVETQKCSTAHDRKCEKKPSTTSKIWAPSIIRQSMITMQNIQNIRSLGAPDIHTTDLSASGTAGQTEITKTPSVPSSKTIDWIDWTEASTTERPDPDPEERTSGTEKLVQWGLVSGSLALLAVAVAILLCWIRRRRKRRRRTRKKNEDSNGSAHQSTPLMQQHGLDTLISNIKTADRKFITMHLNGKDTHGYHYWKFVADHVGLKEEKKNWEQSDNPAEKFLHAFSVKEHSTIGKLIEACGEEAGLTLLVGELKKRFSAANQSGSDENLAPNGSTWV
ncbi:uncharacterized protein [Porites lutea]|uniref:uncharacterized protein isoform X2 n=1 Tax=Porites lutea TaxID=51062 RepID=UPI003CC664F1